MPLFCYIYAPNLGTQSLVKLSGMEYSTYGIRDGIRELGDR